MSDYILILRSIAKTLSYMYVIVYGLLSPIILGLFYFAIDLFVGTDVRIIKEAFYRRRITLKVECVPCIKLRAFPNIYDVPFYSTQH